MSNVLEKIKSYFNYSEEDEYDDYYEEESSELEPSNKKYSNNVVSLHPNKSSMKIVLYEPVEYNDVTSIADDLKAGKTIILNLNDVEEVTKKQIFHFLTGAAYCLEGQFFKIVTDIFVVAPGNIEIEGFKSELKNKGVFLWQ